MSDESNRNLRPTRLEESDKSNESGHDLGRAVSDESNHVRATRVATQRTAAEAQSGGGDADADGEGGTLLAAAKARAKAATKGRSKKPKAHASHNGRKASQQQ